MSPLPALPAGGGDIPAPGPGGTVTLTAIQASRLAQTLAILANYLTVQLVACGTAAPAPAAPPAAGSP